MVENTEPDQKPPTSGYLKYTSLAFQLIAVIVLALFLGRFIDNKWNPGNPPYYTAGLVFILTVAYLYSIVRELTRKKP